MADSICATRLLQSKPKTATFCKILQTYKSTTHHHHIFFYLNRMTTNLITKQLSNHIELNN